MTSVTLSLPQLALIVATRAMAAAGAALLVADRLDRGQRRAVGMTLVAVGALTTLPLAAEVISAARARRADTTDQDATRTRPDAAQAQGRSSRMVTSP